MRHLVTIVAAAAILITAGVPALPQGGGIGNGGPFVQGGMTSSHSDANSFVATYNYPPGAMVPALTGAPYSGHMSSQTVRTLLNGTHLSQPGFEQPMTYRDSMGRTRTSRTFGAGPLQKQGTSVSLVEIADPVAGYRYILDPVHQVAHRIPVKVRQNQALRPVAATAAAASIAIPPTSRTMPNGAIATSETLGSQTMSGIPVMGTKTTMVYPEGTFQGNDAPVTMVTELWMSLQYGVSVLSKNTGPEGDTTMAMKDFSAEEPDPALFQIPAGYQIVDETGPFTITIPRNAQ